MDAALKAHLESFFRGHQSELCVWPLGPMAKRSPEFRVVRFAPGPRTGLWTYCSSGAWELAQPGASLLEFVMLTEEPSDRLVELVTMVAHYTGEHLLGRGHTLGIGEPWLPGSQCDSLLLSTPYPFGPDLELCEQADSHVHYLWALPITKVERQFKVTHGLEALESRFDDAELEYWRPERSSVL